MMINLNAAGKRRKELVKAMSEFLEVEPEHMDDPTFEYDIDGYYVARNGNLDICDRRDSEEVEALIDFLAEAGFLPDADESETAPEA